MKKNSFLTFCFAFIPGAGEMYLGMMKKGLAVMLLFWSLSMVAGVLFPPLLFFCFKITLICRFSSIENCPLVYAS